LDQDNEWYETKLEHVVPWRTNKRTDVLYTDSDVIDGGDQTTFGCSQSRQKVWLATLQKGDRRHPLQRHFCDAGADDEQETGL